MTKTFIPAEDWYVVAVNKEGRAVKDPMAIAFWSFDETNNEVIAWAGNASSPLSAYSDHPDSTVVEQTGVRLVFCHKKQMPKRAQSAELLEDSSEDED